MPPVAPRNRAGKTGPPRKQLRESPYASPLQSEEQHERPDGPAGCALDQLGELGLAGEEHLGRASPRRRGKDHREAADAQSDDRRQGDRAPPDDGLEEQAEAPDRGADHGCGEADPGRPEELGAVRAPERGDARDSQREGPEAGPRVEPHEDQRADPAASRPGTSTTPSIGPPSPAASISRNAPTSGEPRSVLIAAKLPAAPITATAFAGASFLRRWIGEDAQSAPDRDQRRLRARARPRGRGRERREDDPRQFDRRHRAARLEPFRRLVPGGAGQVANRQRDEQPGERRPGKRPPHGLVCEPELLRKRREDVRLRLGDPLEEEVRDERDHGAHHPAEHEQDR